MNIKRITKYAAPILRHCIYVLLSTILLINHFTLNAQIFSNGDWVKIVPSEGLPDNIDVQPANNNLDVILYHGRYFLAFRTAPNHFASSKAHIYVVSSSDLENWQYEFTIHKNMDLREPRFFTFHDSLFLYCFEGGDKMLRFEPRFIHYTIRSPEGEWKQVQNAGLDGYVPWRIRTSRDKLYLSAYYGKDLYQEKHKAELRLFESDDGKNWEPISEKPQLTHPRSVSEGAFVFDDKGDIWGVARLEYDGSYTFHAEADNISQWSHKYSEHKYDSSIIFEYLGRIFLISRRNLDGDGRFNRINSKHKRNLIRYSLTRKTTSLFILNKEDLTWIHLKDFKSTGDTAFPGLIEIEDGTWLLFNYSSDIRKRKKNWISGQLGPTYIYMTKLRANPDLLIHEYPTKH